MRLKRSVGIFRGERLQKQVGVNIPLASRYWRTRRLSVWPHPCQSVAWSMVRMGCPLCFLWKQEGKVSAKAEVTYRLTIFCTW